MVFELIWVMARGCERNTSLGTVRTCGLVVRTNPTSFPNIFYTVLCNTHLRSNCLLTVYKTYKYTKVDKNHRRRAHFASEMSLSFERHPGRVSSPWRRTRCWRASLFIGVSKNVFCSTILDVYDVGNFPQEANTAFTAVSYTNEKLW